MDVLNILMIVIWLAIPAWIILSKKPVSKVDYTLLAMANFFNLLRALVCFYGA